MISPSTVDHVPLTSVGAFSVDTGLTLRTRRTVAKTFIDINTIAQCILNEAAAALHFRATAERSGRVLAVEGWQTVVSSCCTFINIFTGVILRELIASAAVDLPLTAEGTDLIDADLSHLTIVRSRDTFIYIITRDAVGLELVPGITGTDYAASGISALLVAWSATSAAVVQGGVFVISAVDQSVVGFILVWGFVPVLSFHTAGPEH